MSSLGLGTYLGQMSQEAGRGYTEAVVAALRGGINFLDTSLNYRTQHSEQNIGEALRTLLGGGEIDRDEFLVSTKAGYLVPGAVPSAILRRDDIVGNMHSLAPDFLADQLERSRANLGLETIDVFYLHNPETQLQFLPHDEFHRRVRAAFERLEALASEGKIVAYGAATWDGFRKPGQLDLERLAEIAGEAGGPGHRFRFIQLPLNLAMTEALARDVPGRAASLGIEVVASASMLQGRLASGLPEELVRRLAPDGPGALAALQFARSAPSVAVALAGMGRPEHVRENLRLAALPPLSAAEFQQLFVEA